MSVLIKGMEMPTSCEKCPFEREILSRYVCAISGKARNWGLKTRLSDCPLVPIPPHGRLGDLDELYSRLERWYQTYERAFSESEVIYIRAMLAGVKETPTVIPAEPPKEEEE